MCNPALQAAALASGATGGAAGAAALANKYTPDTMRAWLAGRQPQTQPPSQLPPIELSGEDLARMDTAYMADEMRSRLGHYPQAYGHRAALDAVSRGGYDNSQGGTIEQARDVTSVMGELARRRLEADPTWGPRR